MRTPRKPKLRHIIGANVRRERTARSWAQDELGHRAQLTQGYVSELESGKRAITVDALERLAAAFAVEPEVLLRKA